MNVHRWRKLEGWKLLEAMAHPGFNEFKDVHVPYVKLPGGIRSIGELGDLSSGERRE